MKKVFLSLVFAMVSIASFGQVDTLYLSRYHGSTYYHSTLECKKVHKVVGKCVVSNLTGMYQLNKFFRCSECVSRDMMNDIKRTINLKKYDIASIENYNKVQGNKLYFGGLYQQKSARCHFVALGFAGAAGLTAAIPSMMSDRAKEDYGTTGFYVAAGVLGLGAFVSEICAYSFQLKSGKSLKIGATKIQYNF